MSKMDEINKRKFLLIFLIVCAIFLCIGIYNEKRLKETGRYTIGRLDKITYMKGGEVYHYTFFYNNKYISSDMRSDEEGVVGHKYFVVFNPNNINENLMLFDKPVLSKVHSIPINGWNEIPISTKK
ncbi:hypothetical protein ACG2LH_08395 [Zhouia sp. PK063]|uniref:hypothetical protein n=1 Tax=Zhouia sp. PK063 TaxID=3373602 RepID=UPI003791AD29